MSDYNSSSESELDEIFFDDEIIDLSNRELVTFDKKITSLLVVADKDLNKRDKILRGIIHIHFLLNHGIKWQIEKKN